MFNKLGLGTSFLKHILISQIRATIKIFKTRRFWIFLFKKPKGFGLNRQISKSRIPCYFSIGSIRILANKCVLSTLILLWKYNVRTNVNSDFFSFKKFYAKVSIARHFMIISLFKSCALQQQQMILYIFHVLIIFYIYQTIHSFPNKFKYLLTKFRRCLQQNSEGKTVSSFIFHGHFDH